jgi:hypothetical protein
MFGRAWKASSTELAAALHGSLSREIRDVWAKCVVFLRQNPNLIRSTFSHSFIHQWLYSPLLGPGLFFSFVIFFTQTIGLLGRVISPSQDRYLHTGQHKHRIKAHTDIHASSGIRFHDPIVRASEDCSCLRPRDHRDRPS